MRDPLERFLVKVNFTEDCWEWTATKNPKGYGRFRVGKVRQAHRWLWEQVVAPIPEGLELDHLCKNRGCVNPDHLEPVTHQVNVARAKPNSVALKAMWAERHAEQTRCSKGHEFTEENTAWYRNRRQCRTCNRDYRRQYNAARRAA